MVIKRMTPIKRKRAKPRARGTGCQYGKRCIAIGEYRGKRVCAKHWADALFGAITRDACDGECWAQGKAIACNGELQCAHIFSRRYTSLRWAEGNAMPLCAAHHYWYTLRPADWEQWCRDSGVDWGHLRWRALNEAPMDPLDVIASLSPLLDKEDG